MRVGLIGYGYWGPNLARALNQTEKCEFVACCDANPRSLGKAVRAYPSLKGFSSANELWDSVDGVVIATPIATHFELAREALLRGKHVMVEKPLAHSSRLAEELVELAERHKCTLMTGHTFIYSPPVNVVKNLIEDGTLGDIHYISLSRVNLGLYQKDVDVIWDLAVHDVSILLHWLDEMPVWGSSFGRACVQKDKNDVAFIWLQFPSGVVASIEISWLSPQKMRRTSIVGSKRMIVYDDTEPSEKIKIYDRGVVVKQPESFGEHQLTYRLGDMVAPNLSNVEPLLVEIEHFIDCSASGQRPRTDGVFGLKVVQVLEEVVKRSLSVRPSALTPKLVELEGVA
jgi:predicted dehydrogenase